jgi:hypothetical protein
VSKTILHLFADLGSDSHFYDLDPSYSVIRVGEDPGVENYHIPDGIDIHGVIANPVCTDLSTARGFHKTRDVSNALSLVDECLRVIKEAKPVWWVMENPAMGRLKDHLGKPKHTYQPWQYGSPWTKKTALWGNFTMPKPLYEDWESVPKNEELYVRPGRGKPSLAFLHRASIRHMPEYSWCSDRVKTDADLRSLCSMGFAKAFKEANQ